MSRLLQGRFILRPSSKPLNQGNRSYTFFYILCGVLLAINIAVNAIWLESSRDGLKDLGSFLHSGAAYREGLNPYAYHEELDPQPLSPDTLNLNPPVSVYVFAPLTYLDTEVVQGIFIIGSIVLIGGAVAALMVAYPEKRNLLALLAVLSLAGFWHLFWYIQLYAPLIAAIVASWLLIRRGSLVPAGILIGFVVAVKPNYALVPLLLLVAGHYRLAFPAIGTAAAISAIPLVIDGPGIYFQWLAFTLDFEGMTWTSNSSLISVGERLNAPLFGKALAALLLAGVLYWHWRYRPAMSDSMAAGLMTVVLFGPVSWAGYTLMLLPFIFSRPWDAPMWAAILLLDIPFSPEGAGDSVGRQMISLGIPLPEIATTLTAPVREFALSLPNIDLGFSLRTFVSAMMGSVYAWAVLLLLGRLVHTTTPLRMPARLRRPAIRLSRAIRPARPATAGAASRAVTPAD